MKKSFIFTIFTFFLLNSIIYAQSGKVLLVQGKVTDNNGRNVSTMITFTSPEGKPVNSKLNSNDGSYQVVLMPATSYIVTFKDYIVSLEQSKYITPSISQYTELSKDFRVTKIETGLEILNFDAFNTNSSELNSLSTENFKLLKDFLVLNQKISLNIIISSNDSYFKTGSRKVEEIVKKKKKIRTVKISQDEQLEELIDKRINAVKVYLDRINVPIRKITFIKNITAGTPLSKPKAKSKTKSSKKSQSAEPEVIKSDIFIKVDKIANL